MMQQARMRLLNLVSFVMLCFAAIVPSSAKTVEQNQSFDTFALIEEVRTREPNEPLIMHVATEWTKLHLRWHSHDKTVVAELTDDGSMLRIDVKSEAHCFSSADYQRYRGTSGEPALWQAISTTVHGLLRVCPRVNRLAALRYSRELGQSVDDFHTGVEAMKSRSFILFGTNLKRCRPKPVKPKELSIIYPFPSTCSGVW